MFVGKVKYQAKISSFLIGAGTFLLFAMVLEHLMQNALATLSAEAAEQTAVKLSSLWTTPAPLFFVSGIERVGAIVWHIGLSMLIYRAVTSGKRGIAALAYGIHFAVDFFAVACAPVFPTYVMEACIFVLAIGTLVLSLKLNQQEFYCWNKRKINRDSERVMGE